MARRWASWAPWPAPRPWSIRPSSSSSTASSLGSISELERLAGETGIPILAVATVDAQTAERVAASVSEVGLTLRPGSILLALLATDSEARVPSGPRRLDLGLRRVCDGFALTIPLDLDWTCRWIEDHR